MEGYLNKNAGKPDISWWNLQIRRGLAFRKESAFEDKWDTWRRYYRNEFKPGVLPSNIFFKMIRTIVPRIYFRNPSISVISTKPGMENLIFAKLVERVDNKILKQMKIKNQLKRQIQEAFMFGTGVGKLGFGSQFHSSPEGVGITEAPIYRDDQERVEYNFDVMPNMPWYSKWPVAGYVLPANTAYREQARWECFITRRPVADVKIDTRFKNTKDIRAMKQNFELGQQTLVSAREPIEMIDLFEIRDKKTGMVFIISPQVTDKPLAVEEDAFMRSGIQPGKVIIFNEDDQRVWGLPDSQILEPQQREINEIRTVTMYHRRLSVMKMLVRRGAILKEEVEKLLNEDILAVVWTEEDPDMAVKLIQAADIPQALLQSEIGVMNDVRENMGFSRNEFGEFQGGRESPTATETQIVKASSDIRIDERRDMVADVLVEIVDDVNTMIFQHWTKEQVVEVSGPAGVPIWVKFRPTMLRRGKYEIKVDPDQSIPQTKELREQKALLMYDRLKMNPIIDPIKLTEYLLHELHGVAFDDMMRGIPQGAGTQENPATPDQFGQIMKNVGNIAPQAIQ